MSTARPKKPDPTPTPPDDRASPPLFAKFRGTGITSSVLAAGEAPTRADVTGDIATSARTRPSAESLRTAKILVGGVPVSNADARADRLAVKLDGLRRAAHSMKR